MFLLVFIDDSWLLGSSVMFAPRETFSFGSRRCTDEDTWSNVSSSGKITHLLPKLLDLAS